ncbi:MAG: PLP-dependent aminotransferase family protein [Pseudobutyrivibrio sp.]|nr:PLP-dependent aminotransferase family protein [Pseudobutyrivibrio sp.]
MKVYEKVYNYYIKQIENGDLPAASRMPSLRECESTLGVSRTSAETAYMQLAADGYIYSVEKVGFFVTDIVMRNEDLKSDREVKASEGPKDYLYDLATIGEDKEVSCLLLWRRYMKSALRQEDRLLSYAENQGEQDLRTEIASYVRKNRNIICNPQDIVIGAGFQTLLSILIALIPGEKSISFPTRDFSDAAATFADAGFQVNYRDKSSHIIYVTPSYMTKWGQVMTVKRRHELIDHARKDGHLLIEDDYQNEFVFDNKPTPSLYAMTGGEDIAFLGSFSRVLLPSVRISYLILPKGVRGEYERIKNNYNQTASKAEQIALTQFLRDGHMNRHIKKLKRCYEGKRDVMFADLIDLFGGKKQKNSGANRDQVITIADYDKPSVYMGESGMEIGLYLPGEDMGSRLAKSRVKTNILYEWDKGVFLLLSSSKIPLEDINQSLECLKEDIS